ncbi:LPS export ABC transporter periplasmic protein LptC [Pontimicrobium sp. IMCC45349]|uniref:LPS export ABC transporter periplasmic protein LptC n=1 Tax=Pontimicrobium sp. IMCC45349 TaxID=3391574 RepID=UPI0039A3032E
MDKTFKYILLNIVTVFAVTLFFSCTNSLKEVQSIGVSKGGPASIAENINTKYTDSGKLTSVLVSPKMFDYSNREFAFYEFPEGVNLTLYDKDNNKSTVVSDYAIVYNETDLIDLQGNVVLTTHANDTLFAEQLFYDQKTEWLFTNQPVKFRTSEYITDGNGFDSNKNFTNAQVLEVTGRIYIDE